MLFDKKITGRERIGWVNGVNKKVLPEYNRDRVSNVTTNIM